MTDKAPLPPATDAGAPNSSAGTKTIKEGSVVMEYPADQESTVFYNPVQVQNRDLSILMITLYGERRAKQLAIKRHQQSLKQQPQQQQSTDTTTAGEPLKQKTDQTNQTNAFKEQMAAFEAALDPSQAVQDLSQENSSNGLCILDALAASGLRSLRYWNEIPGVHHVTINDLDAAAVERAKANVQANKLQAMEIPPVSATATTTNERRARGICIQTGDATTELYNSRSSGKIRPGFLPNDKSWDVIDLDPYGSAAPFLDAALQGVTNGGLICCTCTDMAALGGSRPEVCVGRYGAMPIQRAVYLHEMALRILLQSMAVTAAKYGRTIRPILSVGMDFYVRVFVTVHDDKAGVNSLSHTIGYVYQSTQCPSFEVVNMGQKSRNNNNVIQAGRPPLGECQETGGHYKVGGPLWTGPLHDQEIIQAALDRLTGKSTKSSLNIHQLATKDRLRGLLLSCRDELNDAPLFYRMRDCCKILHMSVPPMQMIRYALINAGYRISAFHKEPEAVKTDAPSTVVWDVLRAWHQQESKQQKKNASKPPKEGTVAEKILSRPIVTKIDFTKPKGELPKILLEKEGTANDKVARFPINPPNWGPKKAATGYKRKAPATTTGEEGELPDPTNENKKLFVQDPESSDAMAVEGDGKNEKE